MLDDEQVTGTRRSMEERIRRLLDSPKTLG